MAGTKPQKGWIAEPGLIAKVTPRRDWRPKSTSIEQRHRLPLRHQQFDLPQQHHNCSVLSLFSGITKAPFQAVFSPKLGSKRVGQVRVTCLTETIRSAEIQIVMPMNLI
jgi:hypothetical protein